MISLFFLASSVCLASIVRLSSSALARAFSRSAASPSARVRCCCSSVLSCSSLCYIFCLRASASASLRSSSFVSCEILSSRGLRASFSFSTATCSCTLSFSSWRICALSLSRSRLASCSLNYNCDRNLSSCALSPAT